jgi:hypothetical protein
MISGLLFSLAQRAPVAANDRSAEDRSAEGRHFPPAPVKKVKAPADLVRLTQTISVILTALGLCLLLIGTSDWSFNPAQGLKVQTAVLSFTLPVGVVS